MNLDSPSSLSLSVYLYLHKNTIEFTEQGEIGQIITKLNSETHSPANPRPDPEVVALATPRKSYIPAYKLRILLEAEAIAKKGEGGLGAFLRKEGRYSSHLSQWRRQKDALTKEILLAFVIGAPPCPKAGITGSQTLRVMELGYNQIETDTKWTYFHLCHYRCFQSVCGRMGRCLSRVFGIGARANC